MRRFIAAVCLACVAPVAATAETALQADAFVDSIGVNTHLSYFDTPYSYEWSKTFRALQAMGVRHIRDAISSGGVPTHSMRVTGRWRPRAYVAIL